MMKLVKDITLKVEFKFLHIKYGCSTINLSFLKDRLKKLQWNTVKPLITNTSKVFINSLLSDNGMLQIFSFLIKWLHGTLWNCSRIFMAIYLQWYQGFIDNIHFLSLRPNKWLKSGRTPVIDEFNTASYFLTTLWISPISKR